MSRSKQQLVGADLSRLSPISQTVFTQHMVRKTKAQKQAFRAEARAVLEQNGWQVNEEAAGTLVKNHNLVVGDVDSAHLIFTAHYDTPARLPFPNFVTPRNMLALVVYQLLIAGLFFAVAMAAMLGLLYLIPNTLVSLFAMWGVLILLMYLMMAGPANPHNANDNTSGVITLLETALALPADRRQGVAFVFFDNEELGLVGSSFFAKKHRALASSALFLNFDCVSDGGHILFAPTAALRGDTAATAKLEAAFALPAPSAGGVREIIFPRSPFTFYPSDQLRFKRAAGVAALHKAPVIGLYLSRLHTGRDVIFQQGNILFLREGCLRLCTAL